MVGSFKVFLYFDPEVPGLRFLQFMDFLLPLLRRFYVFVTDSEHLLKIYMKGWRKGYKESQIR